MVNARGDLRCALPPPRSSLRPTHATTAQTNMYPPKPGDRPKIRPVAVKPAVSVSESIDRFEGSRICPPTRVPCYRPEFQGEIKSRDGLLGLKDEHAVVMGRMRRRAACARAPRATCTSATPPPSLRLQPHLPHTPTPSPPARNSRRRRSACRCGRASTRARTTAPSRRSRRASRCDAHWWRVERRAGQALSAF